MTEINRYWFSKGQKEMESFSDRRGCVRKVKVNGEWREYTEWTTSWNGRSNWKDAVLVAESMIKLPLMIDGVLQGSL